MKVGSLVKWNGQTQYTYNIDAILLEKGVIYTIKSLSTLICGLPGAYLEEIPGHLYALQILVEIQSPGEVDVKDLLTEPELAY